MFYISTKPNGIKNDGMETNCMVTKNKRETKGGFVMKIIMLGAPGAGKVLRQNRLHRRTIFHTSQQVIFSEQILKKEQSLERKHRNTWTKDC